MLQVDVQKIYKYWCFKKRKTHAFNFCIVQTLAFNFNICIVIKNDCIMLGPCRNCLYILHSCKYLNAVCLLLFLPSPAFYLSLCCPSHFLWLGENHCGD